MRSESSNAKFHLLFPAIESRNGFSCLTLPGVSTVVLNTITSMMIGLIIQLFLNDDSVIRVTLTDSRKTYQYGNYSNKYSDDQDDAFHINWQPLLLTEVF